MTTLFSSESVSAGHPDKVADRISDAIVDRIIRLAEAERAELDGNEEGKRPRPARAAIETLVTKGLCVIAGETSFPEVDAAAIAADVIRDIGYDDEDFGPKVEIRVALQHQSAEIGAAVDKDDAGAGDQGLMFGYATSMEHTGAALMPAPIFFSHRILEELAASQARKDGRLGPDAKSQVTLEYRDGVPFRAHTLVVSHQHHGDFSKEELEALCRETFRKVLPEGWFDEDTRVLINPSGSFVKGGPAADAGLTGRKIIVDTYGGAAAHGGGAFSGKDATKVDRSGAYAARWVAKNIVAAGLARRCEIQLAYAIGVADPLAIYVDTRGTGTLPDSALAELIRETVPLSQKAIREQLGLDKAIFERTASFGHFGRTPDADGGFSWERTDLVEKLQAAAARRR